MTKKTLTLHERKGRLMNSLNVLVFVATALYALLDRFLGIEVEAYVYAAFFAFAIVNALLIRFQYIEVSKVFGLLTFNLMIFLVATSEPFTTGMHLHYVTAGAVALALYGYEQWKGAVLFVTLSLVLDVVTFTSGIVLIPWREADIDQARVFFVLNTFIAAVVCVYTFMMYSKMNYDSEVSLKQNELVIRKQNEELHKTNLELDRFVYSASHDLRSPLSTLTGLINLSKIETDNGLKMEYLDLMKERIKSMDSFISEIIDYSRNSRLELNQEAINVKDLLTGIADDLRFAVGKEKVGIEWQIPDDLVLHSDIARLKIVFTNLISNAIKYHDPAKKCSWIKLIGRKTNDQINLIVEDNGIGISEALRSRVFDMFYRAHDHSSGSGLGLYIVKEALAKLSGSIEVESSEGVGSIFIVTLPVEARQDQVQPSNFG